MKFNILPCILALVSSTLVFAAPIDSPTHALASLNMTAPAPANLALADLLYTNLSRVTLSSRYEPWVTKSIVEKFTFEITMDKFLYYRHWGMPRGLDWKSEGCTTVLDKPMEYDCKFCVLNIRILLRCLGDAFASIEQSISVSHGVIRPASKVVCFYL